MSSLVETLQAGMVPDSNGQTKPWGFSSEFLQSGKPFELVMTTIVNMAQYLIAVNTNPQTGQFDFEAPSSSSWEENPFPGGMTSDTGMIVVAFEKLQDLLFNPEYKGNKNIRQLRKALLDVPNAEILRNSALMAEFIKAGRQKVSERVIAPLQAGEMPMQNPNRKPDTSLCLLAASDYRFHPADPVQDTSTRFKLLKAMKQELLGDYGMRRYNEYRSSNGNKLHDSYLNWQYHSYPVLREALAGKTQDGNVKDFGSGDASDEAALQARQVLSRPETAAQWCLGVSASLQGLARSKTDLLKHIEQRKGSVTEAEKQLLREINSELHDFTNRNLALICGRLKENQPIIRADGTECPENSVMEAYEVVLDLNAQEKRVPGAHTLPWGASQLFDGLNRTQRAHALQEKLVVQGLLR